MEINFRILLPVLLCLYCLKGLSAQTVHDVMTYATKSVEELKCSFTSSVVQWTEQLDDGRAITLFSYDVASSLHVKQANDSKYDNFDYSLEGTNEFDLLITNVDKHDGGRYQCSQFSGTTLTFDVTVEVLPKSITINCSGLSDCMASVERPNAAHQIGCVCMATGVSSEVVEVEWKGVSTINTTSNTTRDMDPTTGTFSISSEITLPPQEETSSLSCILTGYRSQIPERLRSFTYTFSPPVCNLVLQDCSLDEDGTHAFMLCNCSNGSPEINAYRFYNSQKMEIGTQFSSQKKVQVEPNKKETFYCSGCNGVLHNQSVEHEFTCQQGSPGWILIVILILLVVAAVVLVFVMITCMKGGKCCGDSTPGKEKPPTHQRTQGEGEEHTPLQNFGTSVDTGISEYSTSEGPADRSANSKETSAGTQKENEPTFGVEGQTPLASPDLATLEGVPLGGAV